MTKGNPANTPSVDDRELIERLRFVGYLNSDNGDYGLRNPNGPEAADRLESLLSDRAKLELQVRELIADEIFDASTSPDASKSPEYFEAWQQGYDSGLKRLNDRLTDALNRSPDHTP